MPLGRSGYVSRSMLAAIAHVINNPHAVINEISGVGNTAGGLQFSEAPPAKRRRIFPPRTPPRRVFYPRRKTTFGRYNRYRYAKGKRTYRRYYRKY